MFSSPRRPSVRPEAGCRERGCERGFTLIELLVALLLSGLVAASVIQLVTAESRFVATQSARGEVMQSARGTFEVLGGELRAISAAGLLEARDSAVRFRAPRVWGVLCADLAPGATEITAAVPWLGSDAAYGVLAGGALVSNAGVAVRTRDAGWRSTRAVEAVVAAAGAECGAAGATGTELRRLRLRGDAFPAAAARGDLIYLYEELKYDLGVSSGLPGKWVRRSSGMSGGALSQQPLAGPVTKNGGLRLRYLLSNGVVKGTLSPSELDEVVAVSARIAVESHARGAGTLQTRTDSVFVRLRNRAY